MLSSVGLEVMNSTSPELNWKTVTKGRRSRKSVARSLNSVVKVGNCSSPKRVGDFSGSDSDKFGEVVLSQSTSGKSDCVPLKKRRHLLHSPQPHPWASSLRHQDSASPRTRSSSPLSENHEQRSVKLRGGDVSGRFLCDQTESEYSAAGDFSGIELLAAAASMGDDPDNADEKDLSHEHISMPKNSDASSSPTLSKVSLKYESEYSSSNVKVHGGGNMDCFQQNPSAAASKSLCGSPDDGTMPKVSRHHWDLNTLMDAWDEPFDDLIAGDMEKDVGDDMHVEGHKDSKGHVLSNPDGPRDESSDLKIEASILTSVSEDRICSESPNLNEHLQEPPKSIYSNAAIETSDQAGERDPDDRNSIQVLNCDAELKNLNEVTSSDAVLDNSPVTKLCSTSGMPMSDEKTNSISGTVAIMQDEDCSSNVSECERSMVPDGILHASTQDVNSHDMTASESVISCHLKDAKDSRETFEPPGIEISLSTFTQEVRPVLITGSNKQNGGAFVSGSKTADCSGHFETAEFDDKHEDNNHPNEGIRRTIMDDAFKSCSAGAQNENPTTSVGRVGFLIDDLRVSDISQANNVHMADGDVMTVVQGGYDSPYEDGELRGSFFGSLEDNEMESECVDYESDGRNGNGSDAVECPGSEIVEAGSEGSHGSRRSVPLKVSPEGISKSGPVKPSLWKHSVKDDSDNNEIAGKGSNAGSGTTVEQCMEMVEEDDDTKRRQLIDRRDTVVKLTDVDEYASKMTARGKLQSRIEGRSSTDAADGSHLFFMQQCRLRRRGGSYSRPERDLSPDRYMGRYSSRSTTHGDRDGVHQWTSWGSRKRYATNYQGAEGRYQTRPRNKIGESVDKIDGVDFHDQRQNSHYFGVGRRLPPTRGVGNYRSRGHYSQRSGRDFVEDFEPLLPDDDAGPPVRMPRYLSRRDQSFSPSAGRSAHMTIPRRSRSRSRTRSPRPRNKIGESVDKIDGADFHDPRQTAHYLPKGLHRPLMKRSSPVVRDDYFGVGRRIPVTRGVGNYRSRGHYSQRGGRDFVEDFEHPLPDDDAGPPRERSFSPSAVRSAHKTLSRRRSRSRSRTRSPRPWHPQRERIFGTRRHSRSPEFRSERMRQSFSKSSFTSDDYGEDYMPPSRGRFSPQHNCRSPVRVFRRNQRFDAVGPSGRLKSDDYFRPVRPGRFSFMGNGGGGRECKLEANYDDRRQRGGDEGGEMMLSDDAAGNSIRRFRQNAGADTNMNNGDDNVQSY